MAGKEEKKAEQPASAEAAPAGKKPPIKMLAVVAALMLVEGVAIFMVVGMINKKPAEAEAVELHGHEEDLNAIVEVPVIEGRFSHTNSGKQWIFQSNIVLQVKKKNAERVEEELESRKAEINEGIARIFRGATLSQLNSPDLAILKRQLSAYLGEILGKDTDGQGRLEQVLVPRCEGFPVQ